MKKTTEADRESLEKMPDGWFESDTLFPIIPRSDYRCRRLAKLGLLEMKVEDVNNDLTNLRVTFKKKTEKR